MENAIKKTDAIFNLYLRKIQEDKTGIYVVPFEPGMGKTYAAANAIAFTLSNKCSSPEERRLRNKFIYIVPNLSGIAQFINSELKPALEKYGVYSNMSYLVINSVVNNIVKFANLELVPDALREGIYCDLVDAINSYKHINDIKDSRARDRYTKELEDKIYKLDDKFRKEIYNSVRIETNNFEKSSPDEILHLDKYKWISDIYPTALVNDYDVLVMTAKEFMKRNIGVLANNDKYYSPDFLNGRILFVDESDSCKETFLNDIIEDTIRNKNDILQLIENIEKYVSGDYFACGILNQARKTLDENNIKSGKSVTLKQLREMFYNLRSTYYVNLNYLTKNDPESPKAVGRYIFTDGIGIMLAENIKGLRFRYDDANNIVDIYGSLKNFNIENGDTYGVTGLLYSCYHCLHRFAYYVFQLGRVLLNKMKEYGRVNYTIGMAFNVIFTDMEKNCGFTWDQRTVISNMFEHFYRYDEKKEQDGLSSDLSFYNHGFTHINLYDENETFTKFYFHVLAKTPENIFVNIAQKAFVFFVSATSKSKSLSNFNNDYLSQKLGDLFSFVSDADMKLVYQPYEDFWARNDIYNKVKIDVVDVEKIDTWKEANDYFYGLFEVSMADSNVTVIECSRMLKNLCCSANSNSSHSDDDLFFCKRYLGLFYVMKKFIKDSENKAILALFNKLAKNADPAFDIDFIQTVFSAMAALLPLSDRRVSIDFLSGQSEKLTDRIKEINEKRVNGERVFILSSFATASRNLNFVDDICSTDLSSVYVSTVRYLLPKCIDEEFTLDSEKNRYLALVYAEEAFERGVLSPNKLSVLKKYISPSNKTIPSKEVLWYCYNAIKEIRGSYITRAKGYMLTHQQNGRIIRNYSDIVRTVFIDKQQLSYSVPEEVADCYYPNPIDKKLFEEYKKVFGNIEVSPKRKILENKLFMFTVKSMSRIRSFLPAHRHDGQFRQSMWTQDNIAGWKLMGDMVMHLGCFFGDNAYHTWQKMWNNSQPYDAFDTMFGMFDRDICKYRYISTDRFKFVKNTYYSFEGNDNFPKHLIDKKEHPICTASEDDCRLPILMQVKGLRDYFESKGYCTHFTGGKYFALAPIYLNIYKGRLGEAVGKYIFDNFVDVNLTDIKNPNLYERADFSAADYERVYVDFKHYKLFSSFLTNKDYEHDKLLKKATQILHGTDLVVNIIDETPDDHEPYFVGGNEATAPVVVVPGLVDSNGELIMKNIDFIRRICRQRKGVVFGNE